MQKWEEETLTLLLVFLVNALGARGRTEGINVCPVTRRNVLRSECGSILGRKNVDALGPGKSHFLFVYYNRIVCGGENNNSQVNSSN